MDSGAFRAHHIAICPELMRTTEISVAGQTTCVVRSPLSERCLHRTRPTGRLTASDRESGRLTKRWRRLVGSFREATAGMDGVWFGSIREATGGIWPGSDTSTYKDNCNDSEYHSKYNRSTTMEVSCQLTLGFRDHHQYRVPYIASRHYLILATARLSGLAVR